MRTELNVTSRVTQHQYKEVMKSITLETSLQTLHFVTTPTPGYIVAVLEVKGMMPTGKPGETQDYFEVRSGGGIGIKDALAQLHYQVYEFEKEAYFMQPVENDSTGESTKWLLNLLKEIREDLHNMLFPKGNEKQAVVDTQPTA